MADKLKTMISSLLLAPKAFLISQLEENTQFAFHIPPRALMGQCIKGLYLFIPVYVFWEDSKLF